MGALERGRSKKPHSRAKMRQDGLDSVLKPLPFARIEEAPAACIKYYTRGETRGCPAPGG